MKRIVWLVYPIALIHKEGSCLIEELVVDFFFGGIGGEIGGVGVDLGVVLVGFLGGSRGMVSTMVIRFLGYV